LIWLGVITVAAIYGQLIVGATMRHYQAGLAIPDVPLAYGKVLPPTNQAALDAINWQRVRMEPSLPAVSLEQVWLHFGHRLGAVLVSILILALAGMVVRRYRMHPRLVRPALLLVLLLAVQLTLGILTVLLRKPADVASSHVAVGALVLVTAFVLTARATRLFGFAARHAPVARVCNPCEPQPI
jgi:cytochrome c oxidase assembly protein subunit 15